MVLLAKLSCHQSDAPVSPGTQLTQWTVERQLENVAKAAYWSAGIYPYQGLPLCGYSACWRAHSIARRGGISQAIAEMTLG